VIRLGEGRVRLGLCEDTGGRWVPCTRAFLCFVYSRYTRHGRENMVVVVEDENGQGGHTRFGDCGTGSGATAGKSPDARPGSQRLPPETVRCSAVAARCGTNNICSNETTTFASAANDLREGPDLHTKAVFGSFSSPSTTLLAALCLLAPSSDRPQFLSQRPATAMVHHTVTPFPSVRLSFLPRGARIDTVRRSDHACPTNCLLSQRS